MSETDKSNIQDATGIDTDHPLAGVANAAVNYLTLGLVGIDKDGKAKKGILTRGVDESIGEISGRNAARKAQMDTQDQINEQKQALAEQAKNEAARKEQQDRLASTTAASVRKSDAAKTGTALGTSTGPEKDFLGL